MFSIKKPSPVTAKGLQEAAAVGAPGGYLLLDSLAAIEAP
jgi:hypothetical protein